LKVSARKGNSKQAKHCLLRNKLESLFNRKTNKGDGNNTKPTHRR
jgi:hypothetical protein